MFYAMSGGCNYKESYRSFFRAKISLFVALAPTLRFTDSYSPLMSFLYYNFFWIKPIMHTFGVYEILPHQENDPFKNMCSRFGAACGYIT
jgi:hypothetical protein